MKTIIFLLLLCVLHQQQAQEHQSLKVSEPDQRIKRDVSSKVFISGRDKKRIRKQSKERKIKRNNKNNNKNKNSKNNKKNNKNKNSKNNKNNNKNKNSKNNKNNNKNKNRKNNKNNKKNCKKAEKQIRSLQNDIVNMNSEIETKINKMGGKGTMEDIEKEWLNIRITNRKIINNSECKKKANQLKGKLIKLRKLRNKLRGNVGCSAKRPCGKGEGDCQTNEDCNPGLICGKNNCWGEMGYAPMNSKLKDDCCTDHPNYCNPADLLPNTRRTCCSPSSPCPVEHGDCDTDADCQGDLLCGNNNCIDFYPNYAGEMDDCCVNPPTPTPTPTTPMPTTPTQIIPTCNTNPATRCCTKEQPCTLGGGDCEDNDDCADDLVCGSNNCEFNPLADPKSKLDCCEKKTLPNVGAP